jgi:hypothetical protein
MSPGLTCFIRSKMPGSFAARTGVDKGKNPCESGTCESEDHGWGSLLPEQNRKRPRTVFMIWHIGWRLKGRIRRV